MSVDIKDYQKLNEFLLGYEIDSILYGSLGVSVYLGNFKQFDDIDLLIEDSYLLDKWPVLIKIMKNNGFELIDTREHEFKNKQEVKVAFAKKSILVGDNICDPTKDIQTCRKDGILIKTLSKQAFINAYTFSSKDGYRKEKRGKNDLDIVDRLKNMIPPKVVISAILEKIENGQTKIFIQTRWKPKVSPAYSGLIEIPAGCVESYEDVYQTLSREVKEETGLKVVKIISDFQSEVAENRPHDRSKVFMPFVCQQMLETVDGLPWIGFVFRCQVEEGEVKMQESEAKDPRWITIEELELLLKNNPEKIFPLQYSVLQYYLKYLKDNIDK